MIQVLGILSLHVTVLLLAHTRVGQFRQLPDHLSSRSSTFWFSVIG